MKTPRFQPELLSATAAGLTVLVAGLTLADWAWKFNSRQWFPPGYVSMNPMTAVAFVLAGVSLWLQRSADAAPATRWRYFARIAASAVVVIGLLKLAAIALGWDAGVDQWLFADRSAGDYPAFLRPMAPSTALNFVLLGLALVTLDVTTRRGRRPAELLAIVVFLISFMVFTGYFYHAQESIKEAGVITMTLTTTVVFLVLAFGVFVARPGSGMMAVVASATAGGVMARRLFPASVLVLLPLGWIRLEGQRRGFYGSALGVALYTVINIAVFGLLVWWAAKSLYRTETERVRLTTQNRDNEAQMRLLLDSTAEAIYGIDTDGHCTFTNQACMRLLGYADSQSLLGKDMHALFHYARPDGTPSPGEECRISRAIHAGHPVHVDDEVFWRADGTSFAVEYWSHPMHRHGKLVGAVVTFLDITLRKQAETQLLESEARTTAILAAAADAIIIIDARGTIESLNAAAETLFGYTALEMVGQNVKMLMPEPYKVEHDGYLHNYTTTGVKKIIGIGREVVGLRKNGQTFPMDLAVSEVHTGGRRLFIGIVRDIALRKQADASIQALNTELLANAAQLQQINGELESFSYSISHDLRAPLRHIDGYAQMLLEEAGELLSGDPRRYLDAIGDNARRMGLLIDDLLAFSRLGRKTVQRLAVDMDALAGRALQEARASQPGTAQVLLGPLPSTRADPALMHQVWVNLLSNALKYSAARGDDARIEVSGESDGTVNRYRVRDNGVGFDMRYADKLFGVFQRLHSQEEFEGTGVGLAIVQRIVNRHGGRVWAEAEPGLGATFTIELPHIDANTPESAG